mmetsp:Transcript_116069/g.335214  ORF Transcript_116069/g.335214 Transcript_116069/m.335214 type:complete len:294 (-) Transcript_116069:323-1204(-)
MKLVVMEVLSFDIVRLVVCQWPNVISINVILMDASMSPPFIRLGRPTWIPPRSPQPWRLLLEKHRYHPVLLPRPNQSPLPRKKNLKIPPRPSLNNEGSKSGLLPHPRFLRIPTKPSRFQNPVPQYHPIVVEKRRRLWVDHRLPVLMPSKEKIHHPPILAQPLIINYHPRQKIRNLMIRIGSKGHLLLFPNSVKRRSQSTHHPRRRRHGERRRRANEKSDEGNDENCASRELKTWPGCCWNPILIFPLIANIAGRLFWEVDQICKIRIACPPGSWKSWPFPTKSALFVNLAFPV